MRSSFRDSVAWQKAMDLSVAVYEATRTYPKDEVFGLTSQLRRASVSVASNIAEGKGRVSAGEFVHFLGMASGSLLEVQTQLELAGRLGFGNSACNGKAEALSIEVLRMLNATLRTMRSEASARSKRG